MSTTWLTTSVYAFIVSFSLCWTHCFLISSATMLYLLCIVLEHRITPKNVQTVTTVPNNILKCFHSCRWLGSLSLVIRISHFLWRPKFKTTILTITSLFFIVERSGWYHYVRNWNLQMYVQFSVLIKTPSFLQLRPHRVEYQSIVRKLVILF